jgi:hypothetical protein
MHSFTRYNYVTQPTQFAPIQDSPFSLFTVSRELIFLPDVQDMDYHPLPRRPRREPLGVPYLDPLLQDYDHGDLDTYPKGQG